MTSGKDSILNVMRLGNLIYWRLRNLAGTNLIAETQENDAATLDGSMMLLEQYIDLLGPGQYSIEAWSVEGDKKNRKKIPFEIPAGVAGAGIGNIQSPVPAGVSPDEIQSRIEKALDEYKTKERLQNLEKENSELKKQVKEFEKSENSPWNRIIGKLEPFIEPLIKTTGLIQPAAAPALTPISGVEGAEKSKDFEERLEKAFDKWFEVESPETVIALVEKIADLAAKEDMKYNLAKSMI